MTLQGARPPRISRCTAASSPHAAAATSAWTASKDRAAATRFPPRETHPITIMSPARRTARPWTEISMGARAHQLPDSASTAPVKRSALGPQGRPTGDRGPPPALNQQSAVAAATRNNNPGHRTCRGVPAQISSS